MAKMDSGPAGAWIRDRAHRIMKSTVDKYDPKKAKQVAYAVATQQAHSMDKSPKDFRTPAGVSEARQKYDEPSEYKKTAMVAFFDELEKISGAGARLLSLLAEDVAKSPIKYLAQAHRVGEAGKQHRDRMEALEQGYPVGWPSLSMKPR